MCVYLLVRLLEEPVRAEEEPRLESSPRWPVGEVTDEEVVVEEADVVEEPRSSCLRPNDPLWTPRDQRYVEHGEGRGETG